MLYTFRSGVLNHPEDTVLQQITDLVRSGGVLNPSTDFITVEPAGGGLNVDVGAGRGYIKGADTNAYPVRSTETETVAINANSSGSPRITAVIGYIDTAATPDDEGQGADVFKLGTVDGTPSVSPQPPSDSAIQSSIGASKPFFRIANVTVTSGVGGISNSDIEGPAKRVFLKNPSPLLEVEFSTTVTPDLNKSTQQMIELTNDITVNSPINMEVGDWLQLRFSQDAVGGRGITWFSGISWKTTYYDINEDPDQVSVYAFQKISSTTYDGYLIGKDN